VDGGQPQGTEFAGDLSREPGLAGLAVGSNTPAAVSASSGPVEKVLRNILLTSAVSRSTVERPVEFADRFDAKNVARRGGP